MIVAIPSKGRAGKTTSDKLLTTAKIFCPSLEVEAYRRGTKCEVVEVPGDVLGITRTRNWILDHAGNQPVVFVDDDLKSQGWVNMSGIAKHQKKTGAEWLTTFERLFDVCEGMKFPIWGVATQSAPRSVYPYKPFLWKSYVTASCMGIMPGTLRFDESYKVKEDYEICLRCVRDFGGIVAARFCYWENRHWHDEGGCKDYRTKVMELEHIGKLMKEYPGQVQRIKRGGADVSIELFF